MAGAITAATGPILGMWFGCIQYGVQHGDSVALAAELVRRWMKDGDLSDENAGLTQLGFIKTQDGPLEEHAPDAMLFETDEEDKLIGGSAAMTT